MKKALVVLTVLLLMVGAGAVAGGGIKLGATGGSSAEGTSVVVSRDFGADRIDERQTKRIPAGETVMRLLQRHFDVQTRYGGGFVQSIEGLSGDSRGGRRVDWFYYVNGIEASEGAASREVAPGDRIWWDRHDWSAAQRIPAVVGSFPEPFVSGSEGRSIPLAVVCAADERACDEVRTRLSDAGVKAMSSAGIGAALSEGVLRVVVGPWGAIRRDPAVEQLGKGPGASGVFARPTDRGVELLDQEGQVVRTLPDGGLIAATRLHDQQPTWVVTGADGTGVAAAAAALRETVLANRFAVAVDQGRGVPLPVRPVP